MRDAVLLGHYVAFGNQLSFEDFLKKIELSCNKTIGSATNRAKNENEENWNYCALDHDW